MSSTFFPVSAASASGSNEPECEPSRSARSIPSAEAYSPSTGPVFQSTETFVLCGGFPCQDLSVSGKRKGLSGDRSSLLYDLIGLLSKTSGTLGAAGCPNCGASCGPRDMPLCRFECEPVIWARRTKDPASSLLPTPTASSYGSCRGGGMGRVGKWRPSLHSLKILHPEDWERMMGYPIGWTAGELSEIPSFRKSLRSSGGASWER